MTFFKYISLLLFLFLFSSVKIYEDEVKTYVLYKIKTYKTITSKTYDPSNLDFELIYSKNSSIFRMVEKIQIDEENFDQKVKEIIFGGIYIYYKNIEKHEKFKNSPFKDIFYNVALPYEQYKWEILNETKVINGFLCYKAVCSYIEINGKEKITRNPEVWFTSQIPCSFGPGGLDGLPGLVLEGTFDGFSYFYADKIVNNYKTNTKIEKPINCDDITEDKFNDLVNKDLEEINKRHKK